MTTIDHRRFTSDTQQYVATNLTHLQQGSGVLAIALLTISTLAIAVTVGNLNPAAAIFQVGLTGEAIGFIMVLAWGASKNHGGMCLNNSSVADEATDEVNRRIATAKADLDARLDEIAREFTKQLGGISSELRQAVEANHAAVTAACEAAQAAREATQFRYDELTPRRSRN